MDNNGIYNKIMHLTLFKCKLHLTFCNIKTLSEDNVMSNPTKDLQYQRSLHWFFTGNTCTTNFFLNEKVLP